MHRSSRCAGLIGAGVADIFERDPAIARFGEGFHHAEVKIPGFHLAGINCIYFCFEIGGLELFAVEIGKLRHDLGIEERPETVFFDPLHKKVRHPVGEIQVVGAPGAIAGVVAQLQKLFDVGVPGFQIAATSTLPFTALIHRRDRRVERFEPGNDAIGEAVGALDERTARAYSMVGEADAAGEFDSLATSV